MGVLGTLAKIPSASPCLDAASHKMLARPIWLSRGSKENLAGKEIEIDETQDAN